MKINKIIFWLLITALVIAIWGTYSLVSEELNKGNICPKIFSIPACYIVLFCFSIGLIAHIMAPGENGKYIYFVFIGLVLLIALFGSTGEILGLVKCPRTSSGIPMCFISLSICLTLVALKYYHLQLLLKQ